MTGGSRLVNAINLGRMGFMAAYNVQMRFARQHLDFMSHKSKLKGENVVLIVEHNNLYTTGLRDKHYDEAEEQKLKRLGAEFYRTNRGGLITYHGPGQLVAYPVINLKDFHPSMKWYVCALEKTMIRTCGFYNLDARTTEHTGVWIGDKKIGAIGIHGSRYITSHGISLNCSTDLSWYDHIVPCGLDGKEVTSISKELGNEEVTDKDAVVPFLRAFRKEFDCEIESTTLDSADLEIINADRNDLNVDSVCRKEEVKQKVMQRPMW